MKTKDANTLLELQEELYDNEAIEAKKVVSIVVLVDSERKFIDETMITFLQMPRKSLSTFEIIISPYEKNVSPDWNEQVNEYKAKLPNLKILDFDTKISSAATAFARGIQESSAEYVRLVRSNDYLVKESFSIYLSILSMKTPDILFTNTLLFNNEDKQLYPVEHLREVYKEGPTHKVPKSYFPSLYLMTFKKGLISEINFADLPDSAWIFRFISLTALSNSQSIYTTRSFNYVVRTYADKKSLFSSTKTLKNNNNLDAIIRLIRRTNLSNPKTNEITRKFLNIYIRNYLASLNFRKSLPWQNHYVKIMKELEDNKTIKNPKLMKFCFETRWGKSKRFEKAKPIRIHLTDKSKGVVDFM